MERGPISPTHRIALLCTVTLVACARGSAPSEALAPTVDASPSGEPETDESLELTRVLPGTAETLYSAWIDGERHAAFTGSPATVEPRVGGKHTAWGGYIWGELLELEPTRRIVMSWRTQEFPEDAPDSRVELVFEDTPEGVRLTIVHTDIPPGQGVKYEKGWDEHYFQLIEEHFGPDSK